MLDPFPSNLFSNVLGFTVITIPVPNFKNMPCELIEHDGHKFLVCTRGTSRSGRRCAYCDRTSCRLCDYAVADDQTCDVPMCDYCTFTAGRNLDYCKEHRPSGDAKPRKDENAPRWMKALFSGNCYYCRKTVKTGERMLWFKTKKLILLPAKANRLD